MNNIPVRPITDLIYNRSLEHKKVIKHPKCAMTLFYFDTKTQLPKCKECKKTIYTKDYNPKEIEQCCNGIGY